jgi:hypothetical protein
MDLKDFLAPCQGLTLCEKRESSDNHINIVINTKDESLWSERLGQSLGPALKPAGSRPTGEAKKITKEFGGIRTEQTLFMKNIDNTTVLCMFWPWQDGEHTTLKLFVIPKIEHQPQKRKWWFF